MPSRLILLDEWLFSHLQGEEGSELGVPEASE